MFLFTHAGLMIYMKSIRNLHTFAVMHKKQWFETWFDTEYYHILYKHRDENEADLFIDKLVRFLNIPVQSKVLDLACGKGRHAMVLHRYNLEVLGVDLSKNSIKEANETKIYLENNCIRADIGAAVDTIRIKDRILYTILGIMQ